MIFNLRDEFKYTEEQKQKFRKPLSEEEQNKLITKLNFCENGTKDAKVKIVWH